MTLNELERPNDLYFALVHRIRSGKTISLPRFQNLLLIVYDDTNMICEIIQRLFWQNKL